MFGQHHIGEWIKFITTAIETTNLYYLKDSVWYARNQAVHKGKFPDALELAKETARRFTDHSKAWEEKNGASRKWGAPEKDQWKVNCYVAVPRDNLYFAAICRDCSGRVLNAWTGKKRGKNPLTGEALAVALAIKEAGSIIQGNLISLKPTVLIYIISVNQNLQPD